MMPSDNDRSPSQQGHTGDSPLLDDAVLLQEGRHPDPFSVLGCHSNNEGVAIRVFLPGAQQVCLTDNGQSLARIAHSDLFEWRGLTSTLPTYYRLTWLDHHHREHTSYDPYSFPSQLSAYDLHLFNEGRLLHAYRVLGAHLRSIEGIVGTLFSVWAPQAERVSVVGDFNHWNGQAHPLRRRSYVWEIFIPDVVAGMRYQFEIRVRETGEVLRKTDPYGRCFECRPAISSVIASNTAYSWNDLIWMTQRRRRDWSRTPLSIYEVHLGSWQRNQAGEYLSYRDMARRLVAYVGSLGFTHIELMPVTEHPLDVSWGYQTTGYFAPTSRFGTPEDFRWLVDHCHQAGIGVILDWVPGHFPKDDHGLAQFDGTYLYEYEDPTRREHRGWGTLIFNYGRNQVKNFLLASACFWLEECHLDGLRVDAVASMLYLDYARESSEWAPNPFGGNENLDAIAFLRELNDVIHRRYPDVLMIAEESTAWPLVTRSSWMGGLGFGMKWNMGWMHDTLEYLAFDPALRCYHHDLFTFGLLYLFTENFMLSLSHDEVVHGKGSLWTRMPGDRSQRFANLRLLYTYMWTFPGKKLLFMGNEFAQTLEWNCEGSLNWDLAAEREHRGVQTLIRDLNTAYRTYLSLHLYEFDPAGFEWLDCDPMQSVMGYLRHARDEKNQDSVLVIFNFAALSRWGYRVGVPQAGIYREVLNTDAACYGGSGSLIGDVCSVPVSHAGQPCSLLVNLPPLTAVVLSLIQVIDES